MKTPLDTPVDDIELEKDTTISEFVKKLGAAGGFTAKHVAVAADVLERMIEDDDCTVFLSFPACLISTGTRGIIKELVKRKWVDCIITTCGTLDHDMARVWQDYYHGDFAADDAALYDQGINRLGNIFIPNESYGIVLEERMQPILEELWKEGKKEFSTKELVWEFGKRIDDERSIIHWAAKNEIPVYIPGITDGAFGSQLWMFTQTHRDFRVNLFWDEQELSDIVFDAKKTGALMVGGGISKHHTIWWNQYRDGLDMAVYITTAPEFDGSLSGARVKEAVSWGKVRKDAKYVTVDGDASVLLPLIVGAVAGRV